MSQPEKPAWVDSRLDVLMSVLVTLHELEVITDPAISSERQENGVAVTVEFLLDFERVGYPQRRRRIVSDEHQDDEAHWQPVMPFVVCRSQGGPYDDDSFAAGYTLGDLARGLDDPRISVYGALVRSELVPQCDLLAMHLGYEMQSDPWEEHPDEWCNVVFARPQSPVSEREQ